MEFDSHIYRINVEHSYAVHLHSSTTHKNPTDLNTNATVNNFLILLEEIPTWNGITHSESQEFFLADSVRYDREILLLQEKYEDTIQCLQTLIKNIVRVAVRDEERSNELQVQRKIEKLETKLDEAFTGQKQSRGEFIGQLQQRHSLKFAAHSSCAAGTITSLNYQLKTIKQSKKDVEDQLYNLQDQLESKEDEIQGYQKTIQLMKKYKSEISRSFDDAKKNLVTKESELRNFKVRCSVLERELKNCKKKYVMQENTLSDIQSDLDVMKVWLRNWPKSYKGFRKKLVALNDDLMDLVEGQTLSLPITENNFRGLKDKLEARYPASKNGNLEKHDCLARDIEVGLDVLRKNLSLLKDELSQKKEQCSFLEAESRILRAELGFKGS